MTRKQAIKALNALNDLLSDTSPNRQHDPASHWARRRSIANMTPRQAKRFANLALIVFEYNWHNGVNMFVK